MDKELESTFNVFNFIYVINRQLLYYLLLPILLARNLKEELIFILLVSHERQQNLLPILHLFASELLHKHILCNQLILKERHHVRQPTILIASLYHLLRQLLYSRIFTFDHVL